jgi:hypothetical protein
MNFFKNSFEIMYNDVQQKRFAKIAKISTFFKNIDEQIYKVIKRYRPKIMKT